jgi:hypothetical protein
VTDGPLHGPSALLITRRPVPPLRTGRVSSINALRCSRVKGSGISADVPRLSSLIEVVITKIIKIDLIASRSQDEDRQL